MCERSAIDLSNMIRNSYPANNRSRAIRTKIFGVGENDADYVVQPYVNGKQLRCPAYGAWHHILGRAYDAKFAYKNPAYAGVAVCKEWLSFSNFREWWVENSVGGWDIDKDLLLVGNRMYGPDKCIYVPTWLNRFLLNSASARGKFPLGVFLHKQKGKFHAKCAHPISGKTMSLGYHSCPELAHEAWKDCKLNIALELKPMMDEIDPRIYRNAVSIICSER